MGIEVQPFHTFSLTNGEASAAIEAGMAVMLDTNGEALKATGEPKFCGISKYEAASTEAVSVQYGFVDVQVTGTGSAGDKLEVSATAGVLQATATTTDAIVGYALEAWTTAGVIKAYIYPAFVRETIV